MKRVKRVRRPGGAARPPAEHPRGAPDPRASAPSGTRARTVPPAAGPAAPAVTGPRRPP